MKLKDITVKTAKKKDKDYTLADGKGLCLFVTTNGSKLWRYRYRINGKAGILSLGSYPEVSLAEAREKMMNARRDVMNKINPVQKRKAIVAHEENTFEFVAREWYNKFKSKWTDSHAITIIRRLELNVFPWLGTRPISEIKPQELLKLLGAIEKRGAIETAHRVKSIIDQVFRYAFNTGKTEGNPAALLKGVLTPSVEKHHAAITDPKEVSCLMRAIDEYKGSFIVRCALQLAAHTFVRPGELRHAEWTEINLDTAEWNIPADKMKTKTAHLVPLSNQVVSILRDIQPLTGTGKYVFPCHTSKIKPMSENAILSALRRMDYTKEQMTGHGFRAMARTILDEVLKIRPDFIEHQLAHAVRDPLGRAYNRTTHLDERKQMMQTWSDYLDGLKTEEVTK